MTKLLSALIVAAIGAFSFSAQAASHVGAAPMASPMAASAPMAKASAPMKKAKKAKMKKEKMEKMEEKK